MSFTAAVPVVPAALRPLPSGPSGAAAAYWESPAPYCLQTSLRILVRGKQDPTIRLGDGVAWLAFLTPEGPATLNLREEPVPAPGARIQARAWGPGARCALASVPDLLGEKDDWSGFDDEDFRAGLPRMVRETRRRNLSLRLPSTGRIMDSLIPVVLEQKVTVLEAYYAWRYLVTRYGTDAPGPAPAGMKAAPAPQTWRRIPSWDWHKARVDHSRSTTILRACSLASGLERLAGVPLGENLTSKLCSVPGIGAWSAAEITQRTHGAPDSVSVGDYHLAAYVGAALTGRRTDDAGMLKLLEPWRGHRQRVVRMIMLSGYRKPVYGPKLAPMDHRRR
ncbi:3-methyladenine DNA glycosylase [Arthrobacter zhangbolii]|uniref:3-methyladenine DNA glycosylase n=1 Tax=Arthrobacter zhangbolii TaxID=2886936 RepID=A0A9X1M713_9MICC|nr:3-methyladenine DNA glycosylase [Arthrobacter zhangbolii]MCC3272643.1 3-methyladenine DNA glycosylase [Arthrobacter zhangbolii]MCC3293877.1 3-methyladenine DNA glycosylase [Arthrobacter zhangbolii]UON91513.1 3-methyladenine DNA glycosylase [Arthrobacter zhangbolii]